MTSTLGLSATLLNHFETERAGILAFIETLVRKESMSREAAAINRLAEYTGDWLSQVGARVEALSDPKYGTTLRARIDSASAPQQLLVVGHLDTVWPLGTLASRPFRIEDDRAYGPGIFDMKAGVGVACHVAKALQELGQTPRAPVTILLTCDEETGSHFSREIIEEEARSARAAFVLEPPIPGGIVKTARKGVGEFEVIVRGVPAHAGNDPQAGVSAITELAHQILAINGLVDYARGTTLNVGVVSGGVLSNVVAAEARASVDLRFATMEEGSRIAETLGSIRPATEGARIEVKGGINRPPLVRSAEVAALFEHARLLAEEIGFELREGSVGGGSDGNFIAALGVPVLDGLGVDGAGPHAEHEHIIISDIPRRAALVASLLLTT